MRLDKYLKVSRIIKRRTVAKQAAEKEKIEIGNNFESIEEILRDVKMQQKVISNPSLQPCPYR